MLTALLLTLASPVGAFSECSESDLITIQKEIYENMVDLTEKIADAAGYERCKSSKNFIPMQDWSALKKRIWSDPRFRNEYPGNECSARATLLSYELDRLGYGSEKLHVKGPVFALFKTAKGYIGMPYSSHTTNVITLQKEDGRLEKFVVDPMFTDDLMPIDPYVKLITAPSSMAILSTIAPQTAEPAFGGLPLFRAQNEDTRCRYGRALLHRDKLLLDINKDLEHKAKNRISFKDHDKAKAMYQMLLYDAPMEGFDYQTASAQAEMISLFKTWPEQTAKASIKRFLKRFPPR